MPIDFSQLSGEEFEFFCRDLLESLGVQILEGPARGPDSKKDIIIQYNIKDVIGREEQFKFLVQCKNNAKSQKSVYESDLGDIRSACRIHNTRGYLLITTTIPSISVQNNLKAINEERNYYTHHWDKKTLEKYISKSKEGIKILERYGLIQSEYKVYNFHALVPDEFDLLEEINNAIDVEIIAFKSYDEQFDYKNSCLIEHGHVINLNIEDLEDNNLEILLDKLVIFQELEHLVLRNIKLKIFPKSILKLTDLFLLTIAMNNITFIPSEISRLQKLGILDISYNPIDKFDINSEFLKQLEGFFIDKNQISILKKVFQQMKNKNYRIENLDIFGFSDEERHDFFLKYGV